MYQRILVAVDGSEISHRALQEALGLCKALQARLRIVTVVEAVMVSGKADYVDFKEVRKTALHYGEEVQKEAKRLAREGGVEAETKLIEIKRTSDRVRDMIAKEADDWPADLIVIGTHGRRGFSSLIMGSVCEGVVRLASKPVLLIREK